MKKRVGGGKAATDAYRQPQGARGHTKHGALGRIGRSVAHDRLHCAPSSNDVGKRAWAHCADARGVRSIGPPERSDAGCSAGLIRSWGRGRNSHELQAQAGHSSLKRIAHGRNARNAHAQRTRASHPVAHPTHCTTAACCPYTAKRQ